MLLWSIRAPCRVPTFSANKSKSLEKFKNPMTKGDLNQIRVGLLCRVLSLLVYGSPLARQYFISFSLEHEFAIWALSHSHTTQSSVENGGNHWKEEGEIERVVIIYDSYLLLLGQEHLH